MRRYSTKKGPVDSHIESVLPPEPKNCDERPFSHGPPSQTGFIGEMLSSAESRPTNGPPSQTGFIGEMLSSAERTSSNGPPSQTGFIGEMLGSAERRSSNVPPSQTGFIGEMLSSAERRSSNVPPSQTGFIGKTQVSALFSYTCLDNYCLNEYHPNMTPATASLRFDSLEQEVFLNLWRTYDRLRALEDELFARFDLTPQQYNVLRLLRAEHPGTMPTLAVADRLVSRAPDITRILDKLERRGLIVRERPADNRRTVRVSITTSGLALLDEIAVPLRNCHARQLGHLSPKNLNQLGTLLREARRPHEAVDGAWH